VERWPDGLELVVQPVPGAETTSLRVLVRAGGSDDPRMRSGLAHVVEHLLHQHGDGKEGTPLHRDAREAGAILNAHTSADFTTFELDAPRDRFAPLAERYLRMITSPDWADMNLGRELGVVRTEADYQGGGSLIGLVDMALFPSPASQGGPLLGTEESRTDLELRDASRFFEVHYAPDRTTVILAGSVTAEEGRGLVERAYLVPPVRGGPRAAAERPILPIEQRAAAWITFSALGYALDPADAPVCREVAALIELRLIRAVRESGPRVSEVSASCLRLRGNDLLLAFAFTSTFDAPELPAEIEAVFQGIGRAPPGAIERARVDTRLARGRERAQQDPPELAQRIALHVSARGGAQALNQLLPQRLPSTGRLQDLARRSFVPARQVNLHYAPMQD
jgi:zinc protease